MSNIHTQIFRFILVCILIFGGSLFAASLGLHQSLPHSNVVFRKVKSDRWGISNKHSYADTLFDRALDQAVAGMSLEEKIGQMTQIDLGVIAVGEPCALKQPVSLDAEKLKTAIEKYHVGSILNVGCGSGELNINEWKRIIAQIKTAEIAASKLKNSGNNTHIPIFYGIDAIHGANYTTGATLFPQQIAQAATWNPEMVKKAAEATAREVRASGLDWNFSPVVDLARQPLWSRYFETFGEDVYLNQILVKSMISGYQGANGLNFMNTSAQIGTDYVSACLKHFLGYGMPLSGKDRTPAWIPERELREYYLPGFQKAIEMGAMTLMINSGEINGTPVHINYNILTKLLRHELNFKGIAVTDWEDIYKLHHTHKVAASLEEAVKMAINAGVDMSMTPNDYQFTEILIDLVKKGEVPMWRIDESVKRILRVKHKAGIFMDPESHMVFSVFDYLALNHSSLDNSTTIQNGKLVAPSADKNIPRKNEENKTTKSVSTEIIGSPAHQQLALSIAEESITLLKNEQQVLPLKNNQQIILFGDAAHNMNLLNGAWTHTWQGDDEKYRISVNPETPTLFQALSQQHSKVICLCDTVSGKSDSVAINNQMFGSKKYWKNLDKIVKSNTVAVLSLGEKPGTEIPGNINDLNLEISESNKQLLDYFERKNIPVVLILNTGRPRIVTTLVEQSDAVLQAYLSGNFGGKAIANTLLGKNNPSGKLPYTYPRFAGDVVHYDHKHTEKNDIKFGKNAYNPLFDFGHGLSYTQFEYKNIKVIAQKLPRSIHDSTMIEQRTPSGGEKSIPLDDIENSQLTRNWEIYGYTVDIDITNTGKVAGRDVIQIYLSDEFASITPSAKRLVAFEKTSVILPNETQHYRLFIELEQLSFINKDLKRVVEKGDFVISIDQLKQTIYFPENIEIQ
jgi:beta-glucosidase